MSLTIWDHLLFAGLGVVIPLLMIVRSKKDKPLIEYNSREKIQIYYSNSFILWICALLILLIWKLTDRSFGLLGFSEPEYNGLTLALIFGFVFLYGLDLMMETQTKARGQRTIKRWKRNTPFMPVTGKEFFHFLFACITAGVTEEILYRGFVLAYLSAVTESLSMHPVTPVLISAVIFGVSHSYQGWKGAFKVFLVSLFFGFIFIFSGSLYIVMVLHLLVDVVSGLIGLSLMRSEADL